MHDLVKVSFRSQGFEGAYSSIGFIRASCSCGFWNIVPSPRVGLDRFHKGFLHNLVRVSFGSQMFEEDVTFLLVL